MSSTLIPKNPLSILFLATKKLLHKTLYKVWFIVITLSVFAFYILTAILLIPNNNASFQFSLWHSPDYLLLLFLSASTSLLILAQVFLSSRARQTRITTLGQCSLGIFSALWGGLLATAACPSCIIAFLGFLGAGSTLFILENRSYVATAAVSLTLVGLYYNARKILGICETCTISNQHLLKTSKKEKV